MNKNIIDQRVAVLKWILGSDPHHRYWFTMYRTKMYATNSMKRYGGNYGVLTSHIMQNPGTHPLFVTFNNVKKLDYDDTKPIPKTLEGFSKLIKQNEKPINNVKKGAKGSKIVFFQSKFEDQPDGSRQYSKNFKWSTVFSISQCEGPGVEKIIKAWNSLSVNLQGSMEGTSEQFYKALKVFVTSMRLVDKESSSIKPIPTVDTSKPIAMSDYASGTVCTQFDVYQTADPTFDQLLTHMHMMIYAQLQMFGRDFHLWREEYSEEETKPLKKKKVRRVHMICYLVVQQLLSAIAVTCGYDLSKNLQLCSSDLIPVGRNEVAKLAAMKTESVANDSDVWDSIKKSVTISEMLTRGYNTYQERRLVNMIGILHANEHSRNALFVEGSWDIVAPEVYIPIFKKAFPMMTLPSKI